MEYSDGIIYWVIKFLELFSHTFLALIILNKKLEKKRFILLTIGAFITLELLKLVVPEYTIGFVTVITLTILTGILFKVNMLKSLAAYIITGLMIAIIDYIIAFLSMLMFDIKTVEELVAVEEIYIGACLIITLVTFLVGIILLHIKRTQGLNSENTREVKGLGLVVNNAITFLLLLPNLIMLSYYSDQKTVPFGIVSINICAIIILFFVNMYNTNNNIKLAKAEQELLEKEAQQNLIDGLRTFKHDYSNTLQTMNSCLQYNKIDKLKEIFQQVMDETKVITTLDNLNPNKIKDPAIFGILNGKYKKAKENKLKMEVMVFGDTEEMEIDTFDLTRMLGILLDNAIEAAKTSKKKKITFSITERKDDVTFEITNTFSEKNIDVEKIKQKGVSGKGKNRGLGLYKVEEIIKKYDSVENTTQIEGDLFIQILTISKTKILIKS